MERKKCGSAFLGQSKKTNFKILVTNTKHFTAKFESDYTLKIGNVKTSQLKYLSNLCFLVAEPESVSLPSTHKLFLVRRIA